MKSTSKSPLWSIKRSIDHDYYSVIFLWPCRHMLQYLAQIVVFPYSHCRVHTVAVLQRFSHLPFNTIIRSLDNIAAFWYYYGWIDSIPFVCLGYHNIGLPCCSDPLICLLCYIVLGVTVWFIVVVIMVLSKPFGSFDMLPQYYSSPPKDIYIYIHTHCCCPVILLCFCWQYWANLGCVLQLLLIATSGRNLYKF